MAGFRQGGTERPAGGTVRKAEGAGRQVGWWAWGGRCRAVGRATSVGWPV